MYSYNLYHLSLVETCSCIFFNYPIIPRLASFEEKVEGNDEIKKKLELALELEKTKATSIKENNERLSQSQADLNVC